MADIEMSLIQPEIGAGLKNKVEIIPTAHTAGTANIASLFRAVAYKVVVVEHPQTAGIALKPLSMTSSKKVVSQPGLILSPTALELQSRLRTQWPAIMAQARELRQTIPDPIQSLVDLLGSLPGSYATWREILEEPYG